MAEHAETLVVEQRGPLLQLLINRPAQRNALSLDLLDRIGATLAAAASDASLRGAVITAAGDRCFAAGGDLKELDAIRSEAQTRAMSRRGRRALEQVRHFPLPVIAALNGHALGGGAELALACDYRVATIEARIGFLQASLAVTTAWGGGIDLMHALGSARGLELLLSARQLSATEARELGLINRVCAQGETLEDCLTAFAAPLLARPRQVLVAFKAMALAARSALHEQLGALEEAGFIDTWTHEDHWAAVAKAAADRRKG